MSLRSSKSYGFSLVEMMVVITIFVIVTGIVLTNLPAFRDKASLDLVAQELALTIRQAQIFGIGTRSFSDSGQYPSHGINFAPGEPNSLVLFADLPGTTGLTGDGVYDGTTTGCLNECREIYRLPGRVFIDDIQSCQGNSCTSIGNDVLDITFQRPQTDAVFTTQSDSTRRPFSSVEIWLENLRGDKRAVVVSNVGHIYVEKR